MKVFKEMVTLVTQQNLNKIELINDKANGEPENLYHKLFKGISNGSFTTDEEAAAALYQSSPRDKKYLMLKSRLKERIVNSLFFLNYRRSQESAYQQAVYQCNRNYFCAKILITHGARTSAIAMAKATLTQAIKYDLAEIVYLSAKMLRHHFGMIGLKKEYQHYDALVKRSQNVMKAESRIEFMYESLLIRFARTKAFKPEFAEMAREYFNQSKELAKYHHQSFHLQLIHYRIGLLYYQIVRNYRRTLTLCNRLQTYQRKHPQFRLNSREGEIALLKMVCCLFLRDYKNGISNAEDALKYYQKGSNNWFIVMENYFLLAMHAGKYRQAASIFDSVIHHTRFQYLSGEKTEKWKIFDAYLNYVLPGQQKEFKVLKFINDVPIYSRDKAGFYPAVLIAQILFLIDRNDEDRLEKNIESLRIFSTRYLSAKTAPRTTQFIKQLRQIVNHYYKVKTDRRKTVAYIQKLKVIEFGRQGENDTMEIIPYEDILQIILKHWRIIRPPA